MNRISPNQPNYQPGCKPNYRRNFEEESGASQPDKKTKKEQGGGVNHDMHEITVQQDPEKNTYKTQTVSGQNSILIKSKSNEMI